MTHITNNEQQTYELGQALGKRLSGGEIVLLSGDLGAGKTVFAKGIAAGLGVTDRVVSPTFTLMNEYEGRVTLCHYDAYRLQSADEAYEAGLTEYFGDKRCVCVIEWWENIASALSALPAVSVRIRRKDENTRLIEIVDK